MTQDELDRIFVHAVACLRAASVAQIATDTDRAGSEYVDRATDEARAVVAALQAAGARDPAKASITPAPIPLHHLNTPDVRALLAGLEALLPVAERIDAARGRTLERVVAGPAGLDLAEALSQLIARLQLEIHGPSDRLTGGRE